MIRPRMIVRFDTPEQAGLFVAEQASRGVDSVILDPQAASLWGPAAVGGVRVAVLGHRQDGSEDRAADDGAPEGAARKALRIAVTGVVGVGVAAFVLLVLRAILLNPVGSLRLALTCAAWLLAFLCLAAIVSRGAVALFARRDPPDDSIRNRTPAWVIIVLLFVAALLGMFPG